MKDIRMVTQRGEHITVREAELERFTSGIRGELILPDSGNYEEARKLWNGMINRKPGMIVRCSGPSDIIHAIKFVRDRNLLLTVRGGGHNVAGLASVDGGLVIDLSRMRGVRVDPEKRRVQVQGGATLGDVDQGTQAFGLAVPVGLVSATGIAGLTLGGGMGWLTRSHGFTMDNLISAEVVSADGTLKRASSEENGDLLWALKGGGGGFGGVTHFEYRTYSVGPDVWFAGPMYPLEKSEEILSKLIDYMNEAPEELGALAVYWSVPHLHEIPDKLHGKPVIILLACYSGTSEKGEKALKPLREFDRPIFDLSTPMKFLDLQRFLDADYPDGRFYYWKPLYLSNLKDGIMSQLTELAASRPSELTSIDIWFLGGASGRVKEEQTPFAHRNARYMVALESNWESSQDSDRNISWTRNVFGQLKPFSTGGSYLNFPGFAGEDEDYLKGSYGKNLERLSQIKKKYDPESLFRGNLKLQKEDV